MHLNFETYIDIQWCASQYNTNTFETYMWSFYYPNHMWCFSKKSNANICNKCISVTLWIYDSASIIRNSNHASTNFTFRAITHGIWRKYVWNVQSHLGNAQTEWQWLWRHYHNNDFQIILVVLTSPHPCLCMRAMRHLKITQKEHFKK